MKIWFGINNVNQDQHKRMRQIVNHWSFAYNLLDNITPSTTLLNVQFTFHGPSEYNSRMLEKLCRETQLQTELPTYPTIILRRPTSLNNAKFPSFFKIHQSGKFSPICHTQNSRGNDVDNSVSNSTKLYIYLYIPYYGLVKEWVHFPYVWVQKRRDLCGNRTI